MGLGPSAVRLILELHTSGILHDVNRVIEIGSQHLHLKLSELDLLLESASIKQSNKRAFSALETFPDGGVAVPAKLLYELLGVKQYSSFDINKEYDWVQPIDLNFPLDDSQLLESADLVTDFGSAEHAFNIAEAYRTIHRICRPGGVIIAIQAVNRPNGYYCFDHSFYEGIAAANQYKILLSNYIVVLRNGGQFHIPGQPDLMQAFDWSKISSIDICYVFQKEVSGDFKIPYQDEYIKQAHDHRGYKMSYLPDPPSRSYVPVLTGHVYDEFGIRKQTKAARRNYLHEVENLFTTAQGSIGIALTEKILSMIRSELQEVDKLPDEHSIIVCNFPTNLQGVPE